MSEMLEPATDCYTTGHISRCELTACVCSLCKCRQRPK